MGGGTGTGYLYPCKRLPSALRSLLGIVTAIYRLPWRALLLWNWLPIYRARICGHRTALHGIVKAHGDWVITHISRPVPYCHRCVKKMAIRCALCHQAIFIGDPVSTPLFEEPLPIAGCWFNEERHLAVACCRDTCIDTLALRVGIWETPGRVEQIILL